MSLINFTVATHVKAVHAAGRVANTGLLLTKITTGELDREGGVRIQNLIADIGALKSASKQSPPLSKTEYAICQAFYIQTDNAAII